MMVHLPYSSVRESDWTNLGTFVIGKRGFAPCSHSRIFSVVRFHKYSTCLVSNDDACVDVDDATAGGVMSADGMGSIFGGT